jgi:uncharacterized protein YbjT (DUF2867 family)
MAEEKPVLVVGATGYLGSQVVDALLKRGKSVRALVRAKSDAGRLEAKGAEVVRGDMLDVASLIHAMTGVAGAISTAAGYTRNDKNANAIDTFGQSNLAVAAKQTGVPRFVLISILTCDLTPQVPHFWHKKQAEDTFEQLDPARQHVRGGGSPVQARRARWQGHQNHGRPNACAQGPGQSH